MQRKKTLLIFCSWLSLDGNPGVFYREQAKLVEAYYRPILVTFTPREIGLRDLLKIIFSKFVIVNTQRTIENIEVIDLVYQKVWFLPNAYNRWINTKVIKSLKTFLKKSAIDVQLIHAQSLIPAGMWAFQFYKRYNLPYLITEHNQISLLNFSHNDREYLKRVLNSSYCNLVVSKDKIRQFAANNIFFDFTPIGNMISSEFVYKQLTKPKERTKIVTIGAYSLIKDQITILKALELLDKVLKESIDFLWIGCNGWGNDESEKVEQLLSNFRFKNIYIQSKPLLPRKQVAEELSKADLFIFSSISEGMPVSVLEALACGVPVLSTNCGGVDEVINDSNGKIVTVKDFYGLFFWMKKFIDKDLKFDNESISRDILEKYGEEAFRQRLLKLYSQVKAVIQ